MDEEVRRLSVGSKETLHFELILDETNSKSGQAWGTLLVTLGGTIVWGDEADPEGQGDGVVWRWGDLLSFLGKKWPWLMMEEKYPIPVDPLSPLGMRRDAAYRWKNLSEEVVWQEDEALFMFENRHDLARGVKGLFLPSLFFLRQGKNIWACSDDIQMLLAFEEVERCLHELGAFLARAIASSSASCPQGTDALESWRNKDAQAQRLFWELRTGLNRSLRDHLEHGRSPEDFWELHPADVPYQDNEILGAARLSSGFVSLHDQGTVLQRIRETSRVDVAVLDECAHKLSCRIDQAMPPYEQGYVLAAGVRHFFRLTNEDLFDPEKILQEWNVRIEEIRLDDCPLEAFAFWGDRHGPAIILNVDEMARPAHLNGRRTTLAHEICHLLIDREGMLPFSEVLGGHTPLYVEQRARAFAAEVLIPREAAVSCIRTCASLQEALEYMCTKFIVSREVAALQVYNSHISQELSDEEMYRLRMIAGLHG